MILGSEWMKNLSDFTDVNYVQIQKIRHNQAPFKQLKLSKRNGNTGPYLKVNSYRNDMKEFN